MALDNGTRLGPCEILAPVDAGGIAEVSRDGGRASIKNNIVLFRGLKGSVP